MEILNLDAQTLIKKMKLGQYTSYEILTVFYEQAATIGLELEAIAEINMDEAVKMAKKSDQIYLDSRKNGLTNNLPPLLGLPISIKTSLEISNIPLNLGCVKLLDNIPTKDGLYIKLLKELGAIPFITSNVPMCLMISESTNNIYGRVKNPWDRSRTAGGSSGGEAALISSHCSPLGIGNDIAGSIRLPCLYSGICGLKVTSERFTMQGAFFGRNLNEKSFQMNIKPSNGPLGKTVEDLVLLIKNILNNKNMCINDPYVVPLKWNNSEFETEKKLKIGYVEEDVFFAVSKANKRAILETVEILRDSGHELIKLTFPNFEAGVYLLLAILSSGEKLQPICNLIDNENLSKEYTGLIKFYNSSNFSKLLMKIFFKITKEKRNFKLLDKYKVNSANDYLKLSEIHQKLKKDFFNWWNYHNLDILIAPGLPTPAIKHGESEIMFLSHCYTFYFNLFDIPVGVIPITLVKEDEQFYEDEINNDIYVKKTNENMKNSKGLPIGIQVCSSRFKEEICLNVMKEIESKKGFKYNHF